MRPAADHVQSPSKSTTTADKIANGVADNTMDNTTTQTSTESSNIHTPQPVGHNVIFVGSQTSTRPAGVVSTPRERSGSEPPPKRLRREDSASPDQLATPLFRKPRATRPSNVLPALASPSSHASEFTPDIGAASDLVQEVDNLRVQRMTYVAENRRIHQRIIHKHSEEKALIETRIEQDRQLKAEISSQGERVGELEKERHTFGLLLRNYWKLLSDLDKVSNTHSAFLAQQDSPNVPSPLAVADQSIRVTAADTLDTTRRDIREHVKSLEKEQTERHGNFSEAEKVLKRLRDQSAALATQIQHSTATLAQLESSKKQLEEEMQRFA